MGEINWTDESKYWLRYIHTYIASDNPEAAQKVVRGIHAQANLLNIFPEMGYKFEHVSGKHIRILLYGHYRIAYLLEAEGSVYILAVIHGRMDINKYFEDYTRQ